jgi:para-nitrobenzyl esterase
MLMHRRCLGWVLVLVLVDGAGPALSATAAPTAVPRVRVAQGALVGTLDKGARAFLGIPYAEPPVGARRWRAPLPAKAWHGVRDASRFGHNCMQADPKPFGPWTTEFIADPALGEDEDCLTLNVWAPSKPAAAPLPVLVWIHGGGFASGAGSIPIYNGAAFARQDAVIVTINYRLGIFGFLAHPALSAESSRHVSGNYGLLDVIEALRWVHANIGRFGGDAKRVTIAGQSAGAAAVNDLVVSPDARGLFARGIAESGSGMGISLLSLSDAERQGERVQRAAALESIAALRALPAAQVLALKVPPAPNAPPVAGPPLPFGPIIDGAVLPADAGRGDAAVASPVPLLTGFNADEARSMGSSPASAQAFEAQVRARYGAFAERLLALYPHASDAEADASAWLLARDRYMVSLVQWSGARTATSTQAVYAYLFDRVLPGPDAARFRSFHTAEVPYVFSVLDQGGRPFGPQDQVVSQLLQGYWLNFMRSGDPNGAGLPSWPRFDAKSGKVMALGERPGAVWPASSAERFQALGDYAAAGGKLSLF